MRLCRSILLVGLGIGILGQLGARGAAVSVSKHNLSVSGVGLMSSHEGSEICVFCHAPHSGSPKDGLWNHASSGTVYTPYNSTTLKAAVGQPTGASKLCLSCHDGTVALGQLRNRSKPILMRGGVTTMPAGHKGNLGTDLSDDHPISFKYDMALVAADGQLRPPPQGGRVHLDSRGEVQCTSCHDPHSDTFGSFLVMDNTGSSLCITCHDIKGWSRSVHSMSSKTWNGAQPNPWPHTRQSTVAANGCENCHDPHGAGGKQRLMNFAAEEQNCFTCHNGNVAEKNVQADFAKVSAHPVFATAGSHDPLEPALMGTGARHVECADCHNPHATGEAKPGTPAEVVFQGVRGVSAAASPVPQVHAEYEVCFRCHGDTAVGPSKVNRQYPEINTRREFQDLGPTNSFHPVVLQGRNPNVPSLRPPLTTTSLIKCSDCHNSDSGPKAGGSGASGPHGSVYPPLLERQLVLGDVGATTGNSALCFKCHDFGNGAWPQHVQHIGMTSCVTCHDPHASPNQRLINFNPGVVTGARAFQVRGVNHGVCTLTCHGSNHDGSSKFSY